MRSGPYVGICGPAKLSLWEKNAHQDVETNRPPYRRAVTELSHETAADDGFRVDLEAWLRDNWDPGLSLVEWRGRLADSGWACPTWPRQWCGRGLPAAVADSVTEELFRAGTPGVADGVGMLLAAPTILEHGSDEMKKRFVRPTVTGEITWCQLFSEPGAGSDLAGLATRAEPDGKEWTVNGQKVWNTSAQHADFGLLLARTDWDAPKHRGITYFVLPMHQSGVEVRPLRQMNGHASFNEVFLDDARIPADSVIGEIGGGWPVALTTLAHERRLATNRSTLPRADTPGRALREAMAEQASASEPYKWYPQRAGRVDLIVPQALAGSSNADPAVRQEIARVLTLARVAQWTAARAAAQRALGRPPGPEGSLGKLASSNIARAASRAHSLIAGAHGMLSGADGPLGGTIAEILLSVPAVSIAGGTDEIQRNILAERILGLPKEPATDRYIPFRQVLNNTSRQDPKET
jgi:alkylation response protein AidB-like acyl-CoA dehydrogenase